MEHDDDPTNIQPTRSTLWPNGTMAPGNVLHLVYNQVTGFEPFVYDWRQDLRRSADLLLARLTTAGDPWRIVAHSQGGLVVSVAAARWAAKNGNDSKAFSKLVSHVAFVGVPFHGTLKAASAFIKGDDLAPP